MKTSEASKNRHQAPQRISWLKAPSQQWKNKAQQSAQYLDGVMVSTSYLVGIKRRIGREPHAQNEQRHQSGSLSNRITREWWHHTLHSTCQRDVGVVLNSVVQLSGLPSMPSQSDPRAGVDDLANPSTILYPGFVFSRIRLSSRYSCPLRTGIAPSR